MQNAEEEILAYSSLRALISAQSETIDKIIDILDSLKEKQSRIKKDFLNDKDTKIFFNIIIMLRSEEKKKKRY